MSIKDNLRLNNEDYLMLNRALELANFAHMGQVRKYTGMPYIEHPVEVLNVVVQYNQDINVLCATLLHDVLEDGPSNGHDFDALTGMIVVQCNNYVLQLVRSLTDIFTPEDYPEYNRKTRKEMEAVRLGCYEKDVHDVKLADCLCNRSSIVDNDPEFAKVYMEELRYLLPHLNKGDPDLYKRLEVLLEQYELE